MELGELKPVLSALALPPTAPLLLLAIGLLVAAGRRKRLGLAVSAFAGVQIWLLSCWGFALWLSHLLLPTVQPLRPAALDRVQAVVVLGAGVLRDAPEYDVAQPNGYLLARLRYGARLARSSGKPLAFSGGIGWASIGGDIAPEGDAARAALQRDFGITPRWVDGESRDTHENALRSWELLQPAGVRRIALVTHAWHMPRAQREFERAGFEVVPAPTGFLTPQMRPLLLWIPSGEGLADSRIVLREALGLLVQRQPL
jgi:uncharacterized SAM-binding protein YcdF (DUF218 family)